MPSTTPTTLEGMFSIQEEHVRKHESHEKKLHEHDDKFDAHALELQLQKQQINDLKENSVRLENVIMTENRDTRQTIMTSNNQLYDLINNLMGYKSNQSQMTNTSNMAKWESVVKIIGILGSSGGIVTAAMFYIFGN